MIELNTRTDAAGTVVTLWYDRDDKTTMIEIENEAGNELRQVAGDEAAHAFVHPCDRVERLDYPVRGRGRVSTVPTTRTEALLLEGVPVAEEEVV